MAGTPRIVLFAVVAVLASAWPPASRAGGEPLEYRIELTAAASGFDGETCWVHARAGAIPPGGAVGSSKDPLVVMTMQKLLLSGSDVFYALHSLWTDDLGATWTEPELQPVFERRKMGGDIEMTVCDFWPKWHGTPKNSRVSRGFLRSSSSGAILMTP